MLGTAEEVRTTSWAMFSYELLHMDTPVLVDQQKTFIHQLSAETGCLLEYLTNAMANMDGCHESVKGIRVRLNDDDDDDANVVTIDYSVSDGKSSIGGRRNTHKKAQLDMI